jgi:hypothetical protein
MADYDRFGLLRYYAAQAKDGDLRATSESPEINTIIDQLRTAFQTPYRDPLAGTEHKIAGVYLVINGSITDAARNILYSHTGGWLSIVDRSQLELAPLIGRPLSDDERWVRFVAVQMEISKNLRILNQFLPQLETFSPKTGMTLPLRPLRAYALERFLNEIGYQELDPKDISELETMLEWRDMINLIISKLPLGPLGLEFAERAHGALRSFCEEYQDDSDRISKGLDAMREEERPSPGARFEKQFFAHPEDGQKGPPNS